MAVHLSSVLYLIKPAYCTQCTVQYSLYYSGFQFLYLFLILFVQNVPADCDLKEEVCSCLDYIITLITYTTYSTRIFGLNGLRTSILRYFTFFTYNNLLISWVEVHLPPLSLPHFEHLLELVYSVIPRIVESVRRYFIPISTV